MNIESARREYLKLGGILKTLKRCDIAKKFNINSCYLALFRRLTDHDFSLIRALIIDQNLSFDEIAQKFNVPSSHLGIFRKCDDGDLTLIRGLLDERDKMLARRDSLRKHYRFSVQPGCLRLPQTANGAV